MAEKDTKISQKMDTAVVPEEIAGEDKTMAMLEKAEELPIPVVLTRNEEREARREEDKRNALASWVPKTELGRAVKSGKEKDIDKILDSGKKILEPQIIDILIHPESDLLLVGQAKGKFGGGKRRAWRQTQKKTMEGNVSTFSSMAVVGDRNGHIGIGIGKAKEMPIVFEGKIVPRMILPLCLSYDHRLIDGADTARFMKDLVEALEHIT